MGQQASSPGMMMQPMPGMRQYGYGSMMPSNQMGGQRLVGGWGQGGWRNQQFGGMPQFGGFQQMGFPQQNFGSQFGGSSLFAQPQSMYGSPADRIRQLGGAANPKDLMGTGGIRSSSPANPQMGFDMPAGGMESFSPANPQIGYDIGGYQTQPGFRPTEPDAYRGFY